MKVKSESEVTQLYLTLSDPMDYSLPGSSIHGIFQARVLDLGAIAFSAEITHGDYNCILSFTMSFLLALHLFIKKYMFIYFWLSRVIVVVFGLSSFPAARGMVIPSQRSNPHPLH